MRPGSGANGRARDVAMGKRLHSPNRPSGMRSLPDLRHSRLSNPVDDIFECEKQDDQPSRNTKEASDWIGYLPITAPIILIFRMEAVVEKYSRHKYSYDYAEAHVPHGGGLYH